MLNYFLENVEKVKTRKTSIIFILFIFTFKHWVPNSSSKNLIGSYQELS